MVDVRSGRAYNGPNSYVGAQPSTSLAQVIQHGQISAPECLVLPLGWASEVLPTVVAKHLRYSCVEHRAAGAMPAASGVGLSCRDSFLDEFARAIRLRRPNRGCLRRARTQGTDSLAEQPRAVQPRALSNEKSIESSRARWLGATDVGRFHKQWKTKMKRAAHGFKFEASTAVRRSTKGSFCEIGSATVSAAARPSATGRVPEIALCR